MSGLETAIRNALERADRSNAEVRARIYQSARQALESGLRKQEINDPNTVSSQRQRLEVAIRDIEAQERAHLHRTAPAEPQKIEPSFYDPSPGKPLPEREASRGPAVEPDDVQRLVTGGRTANTDFSDFAAERPDSPVHGNGAGIATAGHDDDHFSLQADTPNRPVKKRRGFISRMFIFAVFLAFIALGGWWVYSSGLLIGSKQRDTSVPNPPSRIEEEDFSGRQEQGSLNPQAGFSAEWVEIFSANSNAPPKAGSDATAEKVSTANGPAYRLISRSSSANGSVEIEVPAAALKEMAGRTSTIALTLQALDDRPTQVSIQCDFASLGDCSRHRFAVTSEKADVLFKVSFDGAATANGNGRIGINSDMEGQAKAINLYSVRFLPDR